MSPFNNVVQPPFVAKFAPLVIASALSLHAASAATHTTPLQETRKIAIYDFATGPMGQKLGPADAVCDRARLTPEATEFLANDPDLPYTITKEIAKKFTGKYEVVSAPLGAPLQDGTLVLSGCLTEADRGNAAKRLVGMGMGSSRLAAHVGVSLQTGNGRVPVGSVDVAVKGGNILPPLGPAGLVVHAAKEFRQTMDAQAKKLAGQVVKQMNKKKVGEAAATAANGV